MIALAPTISRRRPRISIAAHPAAVLTCLVATSIVARIVLVFGRELPRYMPDEYLYSQLARSFAEGHGMRVLGEPAGLLALLQPLVTAPTWLAGDPELAFHLTQIVNAVAMSLAAVAVYALARRLGVPTTMSLAAATVTIVSPDLLYVGYVTADALGYLLALLAVLAAVRALERPSISAQLLFLAAAGLATFARIQYAAIPVAVALAGVAIERGKLGVLLHRHLLIVGVPVLGCAAIVFTGGLGRYGAVTSFGVSETTLHWLPASAFLLALAAGGIIVPGATSWTLCQLVRSTDRIRGAFAGLVASLTVILIVGAAVFAGQTGSDRFFERYLMIEIPLAAVAFCCWAGDGRPGRAIAVATATGLLATVARLPLSRYTASQGRADSPLLLAAGRLEQAIGIGNASLVIALVASVGLIVGIGTALGRVGPRAALTMTIVLLAAVSFGAHDADRGLSHAVRVKELGPVPNWVDRAGLRNVMLVQTPDGDQIGAMALIVRNASITRAVLLGREAHPFDGAVSRLAVENDGELRLDGKPIRRPILVSNSATRVLAANARYAASGPGFDLIVSGARVRLAVVARGMYADGWLAGSGSITVFRTDTSQLCRRGTLQLFLPTAAPATYMTVRQGARRQRVEVRPGRTTTLQLETRAHARTFSFVAATPRVVADPGIRTISVEARLTASTFDCSIPHR